MFFDVLLFSAIHPATLGFVFVSNDAEKINNCLRIKVLQEMFLGQYFERSYQVERKYNNEEISMART